MPKFDPTHRRLLDDPARRSVLDPEKIITLAGIQPGDKIVDLGAGTGYFTLPLAEKTGPEGRVYACDLQPEMLETITQKVQEKGLTNVQVLATEESHVPLPSHIADILFLTNVLHEVSDRQSFLSEGLRLLRPGGKMVLVEWEKKAPPPGPSAAERIGREEAVVLLAQHGLTSFDLAAAGPHHYLLVARCKPV